MSWPTKGGNGAGINAATQAALDTKQDVIDPWDPEPTNARTWDAANPLVRFTAAGANTLTIPVGLPIGTQGAAQRGTGAGDITISYAGTKEPNTAIATTEEGQMIVFTVVATNTIAFSGHTPPGPRFINHFDTVADMVSAYANAGAALFALPEGSWARCRRISGSSARSRPMRFSRSYAAVQADALWEAEGMITVYRGSEEFAWSLCCPATAAGSSTSSSDSGTTTTVSHTSHGLPNTPNLCVYVVSGTGWTVGLVRYAYIDANTYKLYAAYNANVPTLKLVGGAPTEATFLTVPVPIEILLPDSQILIDTQWEFNAVASNKYMKVQLGGQDVLNATTNSASFNSLNDVRRIAGMNSLSSQTSQANGSTGAYSLGGAIQRDTVNLASASNLTFLGGPTTTAGNWIRLLSVAVRVLQ